MPSKYSPNIGPMLPGFEISETVELTTSRPLISLPVDSPARISATPGDAPGLPAPDRDYGTSTPESFASWSQDTYSWKTFQLSLVEELTLYLGRWPRSGMMRNGIAYRLPTLAPLTDAIGSSSLPMPKASDAERGGRGELLALVRGKKTRQMWPTPTAITNSGGAAMCKWGGSGSREKLRQMVTPEELNGQLNPMWVEWLMGFPLGWSDLED